jgi:hypothetical protein
MNINWKRVLIAAIWSEVLLYVIYVLTRTYAGSAGRVIALVEMFVLMFPGGLWVARKIESRFILHGVLVGILANVLYFVLIPALRFLYLLLLGGQFQSQAPQAGSPQISSLVLLGLDVALKTLGAAAGAYVGGRRQKVKLAIQNGKASA